MNKSIILLSSIFTVMVYQLAHARDYYGYERVVRDDSDYVYLNGVRYALVPQEEVVEIQPQDLEQNYRGRVLPDLILNRQMKQNLNAK